MQIGIVLPQRDLLGECPLWDTRSQSLYWIDARRHLVRRHTPSTGAYTEWEAPHEIGSIALCESGRLLLALEREFCFLDTATGTFTPLAQIEHPAERMRLNDGRTDRGGRFVVGSMAMGRLAPDGELYQLLPDGRVKTIDRGIMLSNTTCFSPDGRWLYFADSRARKIRRYPYDPATGTVGASEVLVDTEPLASCPDGATVDAEGHLWVAMVEIGQLARFAPDGRLDRTVQLPVTYVTCPCFGGADLDVLYLTSISNSGNLLRSDDPDAGALFRITGLGVRGLEEARFADLPSTESPRTHR